MLRKSKLMTNNAVFLLAMEWRCVIGFFVTISFPPTEGWSVLKHFKAYYCEERLDWKYYMHTVYTSIEHWGIHHIASANSLMGLAAHKPAPRLYDFYQLDTTVAGCMYASHRLLCKSDPSFLHSWSAKTGYKKRLKSLYMYMYVF